MRKIYFIIGASGSGKTACLTPLKNLLPDFTLYDFDSIGVPVDADKKWRQEATEKWIQQLSNTSESRQLCLLGQMVPAEILCSPSAAQLQTISIILLDCADEIRIQRLKKRNNNGVDQNTLNWAAWLRMHCLNPCWEPKVIKEESASVMQFKEWDTLKSWPDRVQINTVNTTHLTVTQTAQAIKHIIKPNMNTTPDHQLSIVFTEAKSQDLEKIIDLLKNDALGQHREQSSNQDKATYCNAFERIKSDQNAKIVIGKYHNEIVAVAQINFIQNLTYEGGIRAQVEGVRVLQTYRAKGIGKLLIEHLIDLAKERDCHLLQLTTDKARPAALNFYEKLGFRPSHIGFKLHLRDL